MKTFLLRLLLAAIAGSFIGLSFYFPYGWPVVPAAFALFLYILSRSTARESFTLGTIFGFCIIGSSLGWVLTLLPLDRMGIYNQVFSVCAVFGVWFLSALVLAATVGLFALQVRTYIKTFWILCIAPFLWIAGELMRAALFSLVMWGSGSTFGTDFSFGFIGYTFAASPGLLWFAQVGGVYALSWLAATLGTFLYIAATHTKISSRARSYSFVGIYICIFAVGFGLPNPLKVEIDPKVVVVDGLRIVPISTHLDPSLYYTQAQLLASEKSLASKINTALEQKPDIIILPEYFHFLRNQMLLPPALRTTLLEGLKKTNTLLVDSEATPGGQGTIVFFDGTSGTVVARQEKHYLMPFGEYLPQSLIFILKSLGFGKEIRDIVANKEYVPSEESFSSRTFTWKSANLAVFACSEVFAPFGYKEASNAGVTILINVASHGWLHSNLLYKETFAMAKVHAVYTGKPYIQAINYQPSFVLYPTF
ncbi:MAG: hypothetical protein NT019_01575 [Candidatus Adlerbacteria bacterium]|nr:hypothetical protein [Candidatus Adlerbacteria bacterium]